MDKLALQRLAIALEVIAGFFLAPELLGEKRIKKLHEFSVGKALTIRAFAEAWVRRMRGNFTEKWSEVFTSRLVFVLLTGVAGISTWVYGQYILGPAVEPRWSRILFAVMVSIYTFIFIHLLDRWNLLGRILAWVYKRRWKSDATKFGSRLLATFVDITSRWMYGATVFFCFVLFVLSFPVFLASFALIPAAYVVAGVAAVVTEKLNNVDFRSTLLRIGIVLFILKNVLQWIALN